MNNTITIRPYQEGDEKEIVELLDLAFNGWPNFDLPCTSLEHWIWKYRDNPQKRIMILIAEKKGEIVGSKHCVPLKIKIGKKDFKCCQGVDVAVHPDYRNLGISSRLHRVTEDYAAKFGMDLIFGFAQHPRVIRSLRKIRQVFPYVIAPFVRIKDIDQFLRSYKQKALTKLGLSFLKAYKKVRTHITLTSPEFKRRSKSVTILELKEVDNRIDEFWKEIRDHYNVAIERDKKYLEWRYFDLRGGKYLVKVAEEGNGILGYIVLRTKENNIINEKPKPVGYIVDLITHPKRLDVVDELLVKGIQYFDKETVNLIQSLIIKNHPHERLFEKQGFFNSRNIFFFSYGVLNKDLEIGDSMDLPKKLHLQYGDTDWR